MPKGDTLGYAQVLCGMCSTSDYIIIIFVLVEFVQLDSLET